MYMTSLNDYIHTGSRKELKKFSQMKIVIPEKKKKSRVYYCFILSYYPQTCKLSQSTQQNLLNLIHSRFEKHDAHKKTLMHHHTSAFCVLLQGNTNPDGYVEYEEKPVSLITFKVLQDTDKKMEDDVNLFYDGEEINEGQLPNSVNGAFLYHYITSSEYISTMFPYDEKLKQMKVRFGNRGVGYLLLCLLQEFTRRVTTSRGIYLSSTPTSHDYYIKMGFMQLHTENEETELWDSSINAPNILTCALREGTCDTANKPLVLTKMLTNDSCDYDRLHRSFALQEYINQKDPKNVSKRYITKMKRTVHNYVNKYQYEAPKWNQTKCQSDFLAKFCILNNANLAFTESFLAEWRDELYINLKDVVSSFFNDLLKLPSKQQRGIQNPSNAERHIIENVGIIPDVTTWQPDGFEIL